MNLKYIPAAGKFPSDEDHWRFDSSRLPFIYHHPTNTLYYSDLGAFHYPILDALGTNDEHGAELEHEGEYSPGEVDGETGIETYPGYLEIPQDVHNKALEIYQDLAYHKHGSAAYTCPHCNDGPFNVDEWWDHMSNHTPWLQVRDPKNLERTDLGYGEDLKTTTVPTHDLPNEVEFTPEKFGSWKEGAVPPKMEWADASCPKGYMVDTSWAYHRPSGNIISEYTHGVQAKYHSYMLDNGLIPHDLNPKDWFFGHVYIPLTGTADYRKIFHFSDVLGTQKDEPSDQEKDTITQALLNSYPVNPKESSIPQAHRMVWLSQPNNDSLKYWHHNPSNTTYAWASWDNSDHHIHHWEIADQLKMVPGDHPYKSFNNDWEGGFWYQNSGKHPADIYGIPSMIDYAPIQAEGDLGNSSF